MAMLLRILALACVYGVATSTVETLFACNSAYAESPGDCQALVNYAACVEQNSAAVDATLVAAAQSQLHTAQRLMVDDCTGFEADGNAQIGVDENGVLFQLKEEGDVTFTRMRRETVSIYDLAADIRDVIVRMDMLNSTVAELRKDMEAEHKALNQKIDDNKDTIEGQLNAQIQAFNNWKITSSVNTEKAAGDCKLFAQSINSNTSSKVAVLSQLRDDDREYAEGLEDELLNRIKGLTSAVNQNISNTLQAAFDYTSGEIDQVKAEVQDNLFLLNKTIVALGGAIGGDVKNCRYILLEGRAAGDGMYTLTSGEQVYCDMKNGGWTRILSNDFTSHRNNVIFNIDCTCSNAMFGLDSNGFRVGTTGCDGQNKLSKTVDGDTANFAWEIVYDGNDYGWVSELRHTGLNHVNAGYDHTDWPTGAELTTTTYLQRNGEFQSVYKGANGAWEYFARYNLGTYDVSIRPQSGLSYPYFSLLYSSGGPASCDTVNSDGFSLTDFELWIK